MKYPELTGICKTAIETGMCKGCNLLENPLFRGKEKCNLVQQPINKIKTILGTQEKMQL